MLGGEALAVAGGGLSGRQPEGLGEGIPEAAVGFEAVVEDHLVDARALAQAGEGLA